MDVQPEGDGAKGIFASYVQDATGGHLLATDDFFGRSDSLIPGGGCPFFQFGEASVEIIQEVIGAAITTARTPVTTTVPALKPEHISLASSTPVMNSTPMAMSMTASVRTFVNSITAIIVITVAMVIQASMPRPHNRSISLCDSIFSPHGEFESKDTLFSKNKSLNPHHLDLTLFAEQQKVAQDFAISNNSLALVMQLKSSKKMNDMAKVAQKNDKITAWDE